MRIIKIVLLFIVLLAITCYCQKDKFTKEDTIINIDVLLQLINDQRTNGCDCSGVYYKPVSPLVWDNSLADAAQLQSNYMAGINRVEHTWKNGTSLVDRLFMVGSDFTSYGENIGFTTGGEEDMIDYWLKSPVHCRNIMNSDFTSMGMARTKNYWSQVFTSND